MISRSTGTRLLLVVAVVMAAAVMVPARMASAAGAKNLHLGIPRLSFTGFTCREIPADHCIADVTLDGTATSNLSTGAGTVHFDAVIDFRYPMGFSDPCNDVVETATTFTFAEGTITTASAHTDCAVHGLRVDTTFAVTGGTGVFSGASGAGREFASAGNFSAFIYNGTISY